MKASWLLMSLLTVLIAAGAAAAADEDSLVIENPEMAGISGFRIYWDRPVVLAEGGATKVADQGTFGKGPVADWSTDKPGAPVFDAIHRSLLVRFPEAADKIAGEIRKGKSVGKLELVFTFVDTEYFPTDYMMPAGMSFMGDIWVRLQPRWHAVAWPLLKPWKADPKTGPTFNANVNGVSYWKRFGAQDEKEDRYAVQLGPTEVSFKSTEGRMDVTALLTDEKFGKGLGERLRRLSDCGFIVRKWETYDALYNHGGYEYGGAPGCRGIMVKAPRLAVTFKAQKAELGNLPPAADVAKLPASGAPTAVMPGEPQVREYIERFKFKQPADMPQWQWERVNDLFKLARTEGGFPGTPEDYVKWIDEYNSIPYRQFRGHHTPLHAETYIMYKDAMPEPVREHARRYWEAWLMPGRPYWELEHNQWGIWTKPENSYFAKTGDWRGNHSFYRDSYTRFISTMNFNHLAATGALLGGGIINDPCALADGRYGLEHWLLRLWSWYDGTTQESIDHYYLGLTLLGQKSFADIGPTPLDRMMGRSMLTKTIEELAGCYHPGLRRFISSSGRTGIAYILAINEGPNSILHTLSKKGAMHDVNNPDRLGMPVAGTDLPPAQVAAQALRGPWAPLWMGSIVDDKPLPYEMTATFKRWGAFIEKPLWKRSYLGRHYGLASLDITAGETVPVMAQWRRTEAQADNVQDIGTLLIRFGVNTTEFYDSVYHGTQVSNANGGVGMQGGPTFTFQHRNRAIVLTSPDKELRGYQRQMPETITSLQSSLALANYQKDPTWKIFVDGQPLGPLPAKARQSARIVIQDGVTYVGIIPIPAADLGRTEEIVITDGGPPVAMQGGGKAAPTLVINSYNYLQPDKPLDRKAADWTRIDRAYGGFIVEMGDATEYESLAAFQKHMADAKLEPVWDEKAGVLQLTYASGPDRLECGFRPEFEGSWDDRTPPDRAFTYRRVNGQWPYLPPGIERDTTLSAMGRTGKLEKNGAALTHQPGRMAYLLTDPAGGNYIFANPLPDPQYMVMEMPGGVKISADGRLGMAQVIVNPKQARLEVWWAAKDEQNTDDMARVLLVSGLRAEPTVTMNGAPWRSWDRLKVNGQWAWVVSLVSATPTAGPPPSIARIPAAAKAQDEAFKTDARIQAALRYETGEDYLLTEPRSGALAFTRLWPGISTYEATVPGGVTVATDGVVALQRLTISKAECRIEMDYAPYMQVDKEGKPIQGRAKALLVFGMDKAPSALLHGKEYKDKVETVSIGGRNAYVIPLFGDPPAEVLQGLEARYTEAMKKLAKKGQQ